MIKCLRILLVFCCALTCLMGQMRPACADSQTLAYITHNDGLIDQYQVAGSGQFSPLSTPAVRAGAHPTRVVVDPSGRFAYVGSGTTKSVYQYRINSDGALAPLSPAQIKVKAIVADLATDSSGRALYAAVNAVVLQFKINANGTLSPMSPAKVQIGGQIRHIAVHPSKPYLYVTQNAGHVAGFRIGRNGALSPLKPAHVAVTGNLGYLAFSSDGRRAYLTRDANTLDTKDQALVQFDVQEYGSLIEASRAPYSIASDHASGATTIAVDPDRHSVYVSAQVAGYIYGFRLSAGRLERYGNDLDYRIARDRRFMTRQQWTSQPDVEAAVLYGIAVGPDRAMYVLNSSGVARFGISTTGELADGPWAAKWPDEIVDGALSRTHATNLTFVAREIADAK